MKWPYCSIINIIPKKFQILREFSVEQWFSNAEDFSRHLAMAKDIVRHNWGRWY